jgi:hypothetical protein
VAEYLDAGRHFDQPLLGSRHIKTSCD